MPNPTPFRSGRHFLQIPGPTNLPERVARAISRSTIDHRGPDFRQLTASVLERLKPIFKTAGPIVIYPSSGTGAWEATLVNTLSPGDRVLFCDSGHFATLWCSLAQRLGIEVERLSGDWREPVDAAAVEARLAEDRGGEIKAVAMVHNETSTGVVNDVAAVRRALDRTGHGALLLVDVISSLASIDYRHDEWGVDVTVAGSQKGLMLPPGLGFNAISDKALAANQRASMPKSYWSWQPIVAANQTQTFPYTPATNLLFGLDEALDMLLEEGLDNVLARHMRLAEATRRAVDGWGLEIFCRDLRARSSSLTAVLMPAGHDADALRATILQAYDLSLGTGLGPIKGQVFRIGHLGDFNELMLAGTLCGIEMGLSRCDVPHRRGGIVAALTYLAGTGARIAIGGLNLREVVANRSPIEVILSI